MKCKKATRMRVPQMQQPSLPPCAANYPQLRETSAAKKRQMLRQPAGRLVKLKSAKMVCSAILRIAIKSSTDRNLVAWTDTTQLKQISTRMYAVRPPFARASLIRWTLQVRPVLSHNYAPMSQPVVVRTSDGRPAIRERSTAIQTGTVGLDLGIAS